MGSIDESRSRRTSLDIVRRTARRSLDGQPPGIRAVLKTEVAEAHRNTAKIEWNDIRDRSLTGYIS